MPDPSLICDLHHRCSGQCRILNPLSKARDWTCLLMDTSWVPNPLSHRGNSCLGSFSGFEIEKGKLLDFPYNNGLCKIIKSSKCLFPWDAPSCWQLNSFSTFPLGRLPFFQRSLCLNDLVVVNFREVLVLGFNKKWEEPFVKSSLKPPPGSVFSI